jgi:hypothetical protein
MNNNLKMAKSSWRGRDSWRLFGISHYSSEKANETFLRDMIVVSQDLGDSFLTHCFHRNAVGQTILLVWTRPIESQTVDKGLVGLGANDDIGIPQDPLNVARGSPSSRPTVAAEMGQKLDEDFLRRDNLHFSQAATHLKCSQMPLVPGMHEGNPIDSISKNSPHGFLGRLGVP